MDSLLYTSLITKRTTFHEYHSLTCCTMKAIISCLKLKMSEPPEMLANYTTEAHNFCQIYRELCDSQSNAKHLQTRSTPTDLQKYGFGTLAVVIVSICPLVSVAIAAFRKSTSYKFIITVMLGLCVGSLCGDALLHLLPVVFGLHSHSPSPSRIQSHDHHGNKHHLDHDHHHDHDQGHDHDQSHIWKMLCVFVSLWGFLILQMIIHGAGKMIERRKLKKKVELVYFDNVAASIDKPHGVQVDGAQPMGSVRSEVFNSPEENSASDTLEVHAHSSVAWMVTIGDALHNFTDGLAIGAAFSQSNFSGLSTSLAILCHELPHEFGDAALMLSAGWSYKLVLLLQFLAQLTAFIGLYIGIALSNAFEDAQIWIFSIAAGMFLYVALCDAVPEILELANSYGTLTICLLSNLGIGLALTVMILLAVFEDKMHNSFQH